LNCITTYINEENEEVIDLKMITLRYIKSYMFVFDLLSTLPIYEVSLLLAFSSASIT